MKIYDAKVNHLTNPLGFYMPRTSFSWKAAESEGTKQKWARIVVCTDEDMKEVIFDSGKDEAADSLAYTADIKLSPRTRYFWRVITCTDAGEEASSDVQWFETSKMDEPWQGKWISCDSSNGRHPVFEKEITLKPEKEVLRARLYICGLGLYEAYYNGQKIGNEYLAPCCNDYNEWVQYQTYDLTAAIKEEGTLSVLLGNGWYKGRFGYWQRENKSFYGDEWKLIAELHIDYADGAHDVIGTDESWKGHRTNITFSNLYDGEHADDTLPASPKENAFPCEAPKGVLSARMSLPVTEHEIFTPIELINTPAGEKVFDLGQEITGVFSLRVNEPAGTVIHVQTGEVLQQGNFYNANLRSAKSEYIYVSDGTEKIIRPHFTFFGYRYAKVEGVSDLKCEDFKGIVLHSDFEETAEIETENALVNRLIQNVRWGMKDNFLDVPTDCPQRDEKMGWTGDAQAFCATATYLADTYAFYGKYLHDMSLEQKALGGKVPDVIPNFGKTDTSSVWGDAATIIPWNLYVFYGDKAILEDSYESMKSWVDYIRKVDGAGHGWRYASHYGDWLALDHPKGGAEQTLGATDEEFIANIYYAQSAKIVSKAASVLGKEEDAEEYGALFDEQISEIKKEYYSSTGRCCIKTQTALLLTLKYHLSDNEELTKKQLRELFEFSGNKLKTGFVGTPLLGNVLTENGMEDIAMKLLLNEEYPGWLYEVKLGATTVWERWNSLLADGTISGIQMNSMNHYAYGSVIEWFIRHVAGINVKEETPGCRFIEIKPLLSWELKKVSASYDSPAGLYKSAWELTDPKHVKIDIEIPFGCRASLTLPFAKDDAYADPLNPAFADVRDGVCILKSGKYFVSYELKKSLKKTYSLDTPIKEILADAAVSAKLKGVLPLDSVPQQLHGQSINFVLEKFGRQLDEKTKAYIEMLLNS